MGSKKRVRLKAPWAEWQENDLPCQFSLDTAQQNRQILIEMIGSMWLASHLRKPGSSTHPFLRWWQQRGRGSFLMLNALAEDLRQLAGTPGLASVLSDFRRRTECLSAWHVIHAAAMVDRSAHAKVEHFYPKSSQKVPDFLVRVGNSRVAVEAKTLQASKHERAFQTRASDIRELVVTEAMAEDRVYPLLVVVVKDADRLPVPTDVAAAVSDAVGKWKGEPRGHYNPLFNVFLEHPVDCGDFLKVYKFTAFFCPRADQDVQRIQDRLRDAGRQLKAVEDETDQAIVWLQLHEHQEPHDVRVLLERRFEGQRLSSVDLCVLSRTGIQTGPSELTIVDGIGFVRNRHKQDVRHTALPIDVLGTRKDVFHNRPPPDWISAYRSIEVDTILSVSPKSVTGVHVQDVRWLTREMLR